MTKNEAKLLLRIVKERINIVRNDGPDPNVVYGGCKILSIGDDCQCALCQMEAMDPDKLKDEVNAFVEKGYTGYEERAFITWTIPIEHMQKG